MSSYPYLFYFRLEQYRTNLHREHTERRYSSLKLSNCMPWKLRMLASLVLRDVGLDKLNVGESMSSYLGSSGIKIRVKKIFDRLIDQYYCDKYHLLVTVILFILLQSLCQTRRSCLFGLSSLGCKDLGHCTHLSIYFQFQNLFTF
jgi:hypothetical protein